LPPISPISPRYYDPMCLLGSLQAVVSGAMPAASAGIVFLALQHGRVSHLFATFARRTIILIIY
ncbi:MAG: hypothetical protein ACFN1B_06910, partial [Prevotella denticola]